MLFVSIILYIYCKVIYIKLQNNNQWIIYDRKQNKELNTKVNNSNDAIINLYNIYI